MWASSGGPLADGIRSPSRGTMAPGSTFRIKFSVDDNYMFGVQQSVRNATSAPVELFPWARVRRDYTPEVQGYYILFEGLLGVVDGTLQETTYAKAKSEGEKKDGIAYSATATGGWAGITDKYWLAALVPDQAVGFEGQLRPSLGGRRPLPGGLHQPGAADDSGRRDASHVLARIRRRQDRAPARPLSGRVTISRASTRRWISAGSIS